MANKETELEHLLAEGGSRESGCYDTLSAIGGEQF